MSIFLVCFPKLFNLPIKPIESGEELIANGDVSDLALADSGVSSGVIGGPFSGIVVGMGRNVEK